MSWLLFFLILAIALTGFLLILASEEDESYRPSSFGQIAETMQNANQAFEQIRLDAFRAIDEAAKRAQEMK